MPSRLGRSEPGRGRHNLPQHTTLTTPTQHQHTAPTHSTNTQHPVSPHTVDADVGAGSASEQRNRAPRTHTDARFVLLGVAWCLVGARELSEMDLRSEPAHGQPEGRPTTDSPKPREETLLGGGEHSPHGGLTRPSTSLPGGVGVESAELGVGSSQLQRVSRCAFQIPDDVSTHNATRDARPRVSRARGPRPSAPRHITWIERRAAAAAAAQRLSGVLGAEWEWAVGSTSRPPKTKDQSAQRHFRQRTTK
jgi:hypothetical protein